MWFEFLLKVFIIFALIFAVACATPRIAKLIDKLSKKKPPAEKEDDLEDDDLEDDGLNDR
jgi:hypothetical protein